MLDIAVSYNRYKFIGHEFLTWLWFIMDRHVEILHQADPELSSLEIGKRLVLEKRKNKIRESITIKGDPVSLAEGALSLQQGSMVSELHLIYRNDEHEWQFNLKGESLSFSALKTPRSGPVETKEDIEGALLEKVYLYEKVTTLVDTLYNRFIRLRVSDRWEREVVPEMRSWIAS